MRIGILGPEGTFSESAARYWLKRFRNESTEAEFRFYETISDVYEGLMRYEIDFGVVPIENSLEGSVSDTLDVLSSGCDEGEDAEERTKIQIVGEVLMPIRIFLLGKGHVRKVVSHPHALAQCKRFLRSLRKKGVEVKAVESTALAAKIASLAPAEEGVAALASEEAARKYKLRVLARDVQDRESVTRFVVLARREYETKPTGHDKTSILIYLKDRPGALYEVLGEFAHRKINLTKIESRPSKKALGDYMFHIDCEGHISEKLVREAIEGVRKKVMMLKILGSYPRDSLKGR
ncbi:MAG: prephenate dehydratase [Candidatus Methanospirare jalkutatii]|nr:prephenate dehydratase [Candidatus Methanospirare jalkutatii]